MAKYGFTAERLAFFSKSQCAFSFETALIRRLGRANLCNMTDGGDGCRGLGAESIKKMSIAKIGKPQRPRTLAERQEISKRVSVAIVSDRGERFDSGKLAELWLRVNGYPTASRCNISSCITGNLHTAYDRTWAKCGSEPKSYKSMKGVKRSKKVKRSDGAIFDSAVSAAKAMNGSQGNISMVCRNERKLAYGFSWCYL